MSEESKFYTTLQYKDYIDDQDHYRSTIENNTVFAKAIKRGLNPDMTKSGGDTYWYQKTVSTDAKYYKYYVRCLANKTLYDPFPKYSTSDNKQSFIDRVCRPETLYREVTLSVFDKYLNYLKTENAQWLKNAQKELNNNAR